MEWWQQLDTFSQVSLGLNVLFFVGNVVQGVLLYRLSLRNKLLVLSHARPAEIARVSGQTVAPIKIEYDATPVEHVWRFLILLRNRGHSPIVPADFVNPIMATREGNHLLGAGLITKDALTEVTVSFENQVAYISVGRLRPREAALIYVDSDSKQTPDLKLEMGSPDWEGTRPGLAAVPPQPVGYAVGFAALLLSLYSATKFVPPPPESGCWTSRRSDFRRDHGGQRLSHY